MDEYNENGLKVYIGCYMNDGNGSINRQGEGSLFKNEVLIYKGNWKNDKREGNGKYYFTNGIVYDGMIRICYVSNLHIQNNSMK